MTRNNNNNNLHTLDNDEPIKIWQYRETFTHTLAELKESIVSDIESQISHLQNQLEDAQSINTLLDLELTLFRMEPTPFCIDDEFKTPIEKLCDIHYAALSSSVNEIKK